MSAITRRTVGGVFVAAAVVVAGVLGLDVTRDDQGTGVVDCFATGPLGLPDGGPRWRGCNVIPVGFSVGTACLPSPCSGRMGDEAVHARALRRPAKAGKPWASRVDAGAVVAQARDGGPCSARAGGALTECVDAVLYEVRAEERRAAENSVDPDDWGCVIPACAPEDFER